MNYPLPFYARAALVLLLFWLLLYGLYVGQTILLPLGFSFLFAVLLRPVEKKLLSWKIPRVPAIVLTLLAAIALLVRLGMLVSSQTASLVGDVPTMQKHLETLWVSIQHFLDRTFHLAPQQQNQLLQKARANTMEDMATILSRAVGPLTMSIATICLVPVYIFVFLYYRDLLIRFIT